MKIATWNVNGIRAREAQFLEWVERERPDAICLQEIKAAPEQLTEALCQLPGYRCYWHGAAGGYSGVSLNVCTDTLGDDPQFSHPTFDRDTRMVQAMAGRLIVASAYVPNGGKDFDDKLRFLAELRDWAANTLAGGHEILLCGDMNVTRTDQDVHSKERNPKTVGQRPEERAAFEALLAEGLVDLGRAFDPDNDGLFTWWPPWRNMRPRNIGWRLDYVLASESLAQRATECKVQADVGTSDHAPVVAAFESLE